MGNGIIAYSTTASASRFEGSLILRDSHTGQELRRVAGRADGRIILLEELSERGSTGPWAVAGAILSWKCPGAWVMLPA